MSSAAVRSTGKQQTANNNQMIFEGACLCVLLALFNHSLTGFADNDAGEYPVMRYFT